MLNIKFEICRPDRNRTPLFNDNVISPEVNLILLCCQDFSSAGSGVDFFDFAPSDVSLRPQQSARLGGRGVLPEDGDFLDNGIDQNFPSYVDFVNYNVNISSNFSSGVELSRGQTALRAPQSRPDIGHQALRCRRGGERAALPGR